MIEYFSSLEELMEAATALLIEREAETLARLAESVMGDEVSVEEGIEERILGPAIREWGRAAFSAAR